jgi:hypothetical protein
MEMAQSVFVGSNSDLVDEITIYGMAISPSDMQPKRSVRDFVELGMHFTQVATVTGILAWSVTCVIHHLSIWNGVHACRLLQEAVE